MWALQHDSSVIPPDKKWHLTSDYLRVPTAISGVEPYGLIHNSPCRMKKAVIMDHLSYRGRLEDVLDGLAAVSCVVSALFASLYGLNAGFSEQLSVSCQLDPVLSLFHCHVFCLFYTPMCTHSFLSFSFLFRFSIFACLNSLTPSSKAQDEEDEIYSFTKSMTDMSQKLPIHESKSVQICGLQLVHLCLDLLSKPFDFSSLLPFFLHPSVIFHSRPLAKRVSNHCQPWPFTQKIGQHAPHILLEFVGARLFQGIFMCVHMSMLHLHK